MKYSIIFTIWAEVTWPLSKHIRKDRYPHMKAYLILEDGTVFTGTSIGSEREVISEIVFNTSMTGYLEVLTDPSYAGQAVVMTYPLIGNYGICHKDMESAKRIIKNPQQFQKRGYHSKLLKRTRHSRYLRYRYKSPYQNIKRKRHHERYDYYKGIYRF